MSRLTMVSNPQQSLDYATTASKLGDLAAPALQAHLLDHGGATSHTTMGKDRVRTISQLMAKIDPTFAFTASTSQPVGKSGFIGFLTGKTLSSYTLPSPLSISRAMEKLLSDSNEGTDITQGRSRLHHMSQQEDSQGFL
jgi:F420-0:gamma-glutamyl ligase-like protein